MKQVKVSVLQTRKNQTSFFEDIVGLYQPTTQTGITNEFKFLNRYCQKYFADSPDEIVTIDHVIDEILTSTSSEEILTSFLDFYQKYVSWRCLSVKPQSFMHSAAPYIKKFAYYKGIRATAEDYSHIKFSQIIEEELYSVTMPELQRLMTLTSADRAAFYTALISGGMRSGEAVQIVKGDMRLVGKRFFITLRAETTKLKRSREVILSEEASALIMERFNSIDNRQLMYLPTLQSESWVIRRQHAAQQFMRLVKKAGIGKGDSRPTLHRLRAYFKKVADKEVSTEWGHRMMGHKGGFMPTYGNLTDEEKLDYFIKAEESLTILDTAKVRAKQTRMENEQNVEIAALRSELQTALSTIRNNQG